MGVNMVAVLGAGAMLNVAGRKTLMAIWTAACGVFLFIQAYSAKADDGNLELAMTILFVCAFEFAPGPVVWLYMGEIMEDKAVSMGATVNWTFVLFISLFTPTLMNSDGFGASGTFAMFGLFNVLGTIFIIIFMRETKGLKDEEVKNLYKPEKLQSGLTAGLTDRKSVV